MNTGSSLRGALFKGHTAVDGLHYEVKGVL
jgi:hypothetical protein